jgi:hypothetical protein
VVLQAVVDETLIHYQQEVWVVVLHEVVHVASELGLGTHLSPQPLCGGGIE